MPEPTEPQGVGEPRPRVRGAGEGGDVGEPGTSTAAPAREGPATPEPGSHDRPADGVEPSAESGRDQPGEGALESVAPAVLSWVTNPTVRADEPRILTLAATVVLAVFAGAAAAVGGDVMAFALAVIYLLMSVGWPLLMQLPAPLTATAVVAVGGLAACITVAATGTEPLLRYLPLVLALSTFLAMLREFARGDGRPRLVESVVGTVTGLVVVTSGAAFIALAIRLQSPLAVPSTMAAVVGGTLAEPLFFTRRWRSLAPYVAMALGGVAGWLLHVLFAGAAQHDYHAPSVFGANAFLAGCSYLARHLLSAQPAIYGERAQLAVAAATIASLGVPAFLVYSSIAGL